MKSILFVGAHPDDETFFAAGTFAKYREQEIAIHVLCATRGDQGKTGGFCTTEELPAVRETELRDAMNAVGGAEIELLSYLDKKLSDAPLEEMRAHLVGCIRRTKPEIVITFDPNGGNLHPDHIAISRFVSDALPVAADQRWLPELGPAHQVSRLLWTPPTLLYRLLPGSNLRSLPGFDFLIDVEPWRDSKVKALESHRTQFPGLKKLFFDDPMGSQTFRVEAFRLAWGPRPQVVPADDLFTD